MNRCILINATNRTIVEAELPDQSTLTFLQTKVGGLVSVVEINATDDLWVDDEGLLKGGDEFFFFRGAGQELFAGNGVVAGHDAEGETVGAQMTVEEVKAHVQFLNRATAYLIAKTKDI